MMRLKFNNKEEKENFLKSIYEYCEKVNWDSFKLESLAKSLDVDVYRVRDWGRIYIRDYMGLTPEEYKEIKNSIHDRILKGSKGHGIIISVPNPVLLHNDITSYRMWNNEVERELVLKYIYNHCEEARYDKDELEVLAGKFGITSDTIERYAGQYAIEFLKIDPQEYYRTKFEFALERRKEIWSKTSHRNQVFAALLNSQSLKECIEIIESSKLSVIYLRAGLVDYLVGYGDLKDEERLKGIIKEYCAYKNEERKKDKKIVREEQLRKEKIKLLQEHLPQSKLLVSKFIESDCMTIRDFCLENNIKNKEEFEKYVEIVREGDESLYQDYSNKISKCQSLRYATIVNKLKVMAFLINNGIEENGKKRDFDLIDYYLNINLSLKNAYDIIVKELNSRDYMKLKIFIRNNLPYSKPNPAVIKGIIGDGKKEEILNYLKQNNIPANMKTYNLVAFRYREGLLDPNQMMLKTRIKGKKI